MKKLLIGALFLISTTSFAKELKICADGDSKHQARVALIHEIGDYNQEFIPHSNIDYPEDFNETVQDIAFNNGTYMACTKVIVNITVPEPKKVKCYQKFEDASGLFGSAKYSIGRLGSSFSYTASSYDEFRAMKNIIGCEEMEEL